MIKGGNEFGRWEKDILLINDTKLFNDHINGDSIYIYKQYTDIVIYSITSFIQQYIIYV